ncbi:T6SS immunity protein Tdi1 domain-containing protein [Pseudarthrobacter sulfonivorans]|uniref:T6SS immunity protein Tdi1 domain-containing protein n=1 Tax=Pseudarthrobacter sulfonivorans TaxID=121292 RepID=UPI002106A0A2|nr:T6SS immunity protein Tdi1 domain-containing protein [Pseudarthrobacter sulfonivorans]
MFETFAKSFTPSSRESAASRNTPDDAVPILQNLFETYGGTTFEGGLYRVHDVASSREASEAAAFAFPALKAPLLCFGFDWLGRQFALDFRRGSAEKPGVVLLEPGTGEALEVPVAFSDFHDYALFRYRDSCLFPEALEDWCAGGGPAPEFNQCIGYKTPLFLGGSDDESNLELTDIDVYWSIMGQLIVATRDLPDGASISSLGIGN